jgi:integrase
MKLRVNFSLKNNDKGEIPIIATINFGTKEFDILKNKTIYKPLRYYIGLKVEKSLWDNVTKLPIEKSKQIEFNRISKIIDDVFNYLTFENKLTNDNFKNELDHRIKGEDKNAIIKKIRLIDFIEKEILTSTRLKPKSIIPYKDFISKIKTYEAKIGKELYSNDINVTVYLDFMNDIRNRVNRINSVWSTQKNFNAVLNEIRRKYKIEVFNATLELANKDKVQISVSDSIYFNFQQIQRIIEYKPKTESMKNVKLILMTLIFTGCRASDVYKIKPEFEHKEKGDSFYYSRFLAEKTDTEIIVPILKPLLDLYKLNGMKPPYPISQKNFNEYAKNIIKECGMDFDVTCSYTDSNGKKQFQTNKFYELVSSHIGRRSFVTNLINFIPVPVLTKITGHRMIEKSIIFSYNKISLLENAVLFRKQVKRAVDENPDYFPFELV